MVPARAAEMVPARAAAEWFRLRSGRSGHRQLTRITVPHCRRHKGRAAAGGDPLRGQRTGALELALTRVPAGSVRAAQALDARSLLRGGGLKGVVAPRLLTGISAQVAGVVLDPRALPPGGARERGRPAPGMSVLRKHSAETWSEAVVGTAAADHKARQLDRAGGILPLPPSSTRHYAQARVPGHLPRGS